MKKEILVRVVLSVAALLALGWLPQLTLAQHGGGHGGGGGGFHGGGGGGFHGGGGGGFHGGGFHGGGGFSSGGHSYNGFHGGGYRGGYYAGRGYGWGGHGHGWGWGRGYGYRWGGWGWGFGFGWPYWGYGWGYPYGYYGYSPGYYVPYSYYSYPPDGSSDYIGEYPPDPSDYDDGRNYNNRPNHNYGPAPNRRPSYNNDNGGRPSMAPADPNAEPEPNQNAPAELSAPQDSGGAVNMKYGEGTATNFAARQRVLSVDPIMATPASYRLARSGATRNSAERARSQKGAPLRPEMQRAIERLRNMPPFARQREIESGSYRQFSAEDKQILRNGEQTPQR